VTESEGFGTPGKGIGLPSSPRRENGLAAPARFAPGCQPLGEENIMALAHDALPDPPSSETSPLAHLAQVIREALNAPKFSLSMPKPQAEAALNELEKILENQENILEEETFSFEEAAQFLFVKEEYLEILINTGAIPYYNKENNRNISRHFLQIYKNKIKRERSEALKQITQDWIEMGIHDYFIDVKF
jgi:hypothetical protein